MTARYLTLDLNLSTGCDLCQGKGVTGELYETPAGEPRGSIVILTDVICPKCRAGRSVEEVNYEPYDQDDADEREADAEDAWLAEEGFYQDDEDQDREPADPRAARDCPSCGGHGWNPLEGLTQGEPTELVYLAVPCGCMEAHMTEVTPA